jgi:hypothetical protein
MKSVCCRVAPLGLSSLMLVGMTALPAASQEAGHVLFVRGAERSGGFLEAGNDASRTEHLADLTDPTTLDPDPATDGFNADTFSGNHGWGELGQLLQTNGFQLSQIVEPTLPGDTGSGQTEGGPIAFESMDLGQYDVIVFGSNNAAYSDAAADAVRDYVAAGGGAIFISDANFGDDWRDASDSDQPFLDRFGLTMNQDRGTYAITPDEYVVPDHPIFEGVAGFDGEGVTPITVNAVLPDGVTVQVLARAEGQVARNVGDGSSRGAATAATELDAAVVLASLGDGRVVGHFDRNTFFNQNGAGTFLNREISLSGGVELDNDEYALNLFRYVANIPEPGSMALAASGLGLLMLRRRA